MNLSGLVGAVAAVAAEDAIRRVRLGELDDLGQVEAYIGAAISNFFAKQGPAIATQLASVLEPATKKAVEVVKPSVMQALKEYTPTFAALAGGMIGLSVILGTWIARREFRRGGRRS